MRMALLCGALFYLLPPVKAQIDYKGFPQWSWHKQDSTEYYLYTPSNIKKDSLYPVALVLHGCCGENYHATPRNTVDPLVRMWHNFGTNTQQIPTYIIAPATSRGWKPHIPALKKVMDDLVKNHKADPRRIYITGFSMGGQGTWEFLQRYPDYFAAAIPAGMNFHGNHGKIKDIPIWANRGETDYWANKLHKDIVTIRQLNGDNRDSAFNYETGLNPVFTSFKGYDHGVQWVAASTQNLTGWAYSKINDGNKYPHVWFQTPQYDQQVTNGSKLDISINAKDPDGSIEKIEVSLNDEFHFTLTQPPYHATIIAPPGNLTLTATAYDNKGKTNRATTAVRSNIITTHKSKTRDRQEHSVHLRNVTTADGITLPVSVLHAGSITHFDGDGEVTVSNAAGFDGLTYIPGINADTTREEANYLTFTTSENTRVYVAYEKKDKLFTSGIPVWLQKWNKVPSKQIVAQYYYYDLYYKDFPSGTITLPHADRLTNNVNNNYFVLVSSRQK